MHITDVLIKPIITEKTNDLLTENKYTFKVNKDANKFQIKNAVEKMFNVEVAKVSTLNMKPKKKRVGRHQGYTSAYKKAIVKLKEGHKIEQFEA